MRRIPIAIAASFMICRTFNGVPRLPMARIVPRTIRDSGSRCVLPACWAVLDGDLEHSLFDTFSKPQHHLIAGVYFQTMFNLLLCLCDSILIEVRKDETSLNFRILIGSQ